MKNRVASMLLFCITVLVAHGVLADPVLDPNCRLQAQCELSDPDGAGVLDSLWAWLGWAD